MRSAVTLTNSLQQVTASIANRLWGGFGSRAGGPTAGGRLGGRGVSRRRGARGRRRRGRRRRTASCGHRRRRRRADARHGGGRRGSGRGGVGPAGGGKRRRRQGVVKVRGRRGDPHAGGRGRRRRRRGRGQVGTGVGRGRGHGGSGWRVAGTQHTGALLGRSSVMSVTVSACERVGVRHTGQVKPRPLPLTHLTGWRDSPFKKTTTRDCANSRHVRRRRRQEVVGTGGRQRGAGLVGVGAGALVQAFRGEAVPRADAPV